MAEHAMSNVMDKRRRQSNLSLMIAILSSCIGANEFLDHMNELPCSVKHAN